MAREEGTGGNRRVYRRKSEGAAKRKCCLNVSESKQWSSIDKKGWREGFTTKVNMVPVLRIKGLVGIWSLCHRWNVHWDGRHQGFPLWSGEKGVFTRESEYICIWTPQTKGTSKFFPGQKWRIQSHVFQCSVSSTWEECIFSFPNSVHVTLSACYRTVPHWTAANNSCHLLSYLDLSLPSVHSFTRPPLLLSKVASRLFWCLSATGHGCKQIV